MAIRIVTDTSCDLPDSIVKAFNVEMVPLRVSFEDGETFLDRYELSSDLFIAKMRASMTLPKTAAPDPAMMMALFEKGLTEAGEVLFISLSSPLSSTYQNAHLARSMLKTERIQIFDSLSASLGTGIMVIQAVKMANQGLNMDELLERLVEIRGNRVMLFTLDSLENLVKGGRLKKYEGLTGNLLNIKPIMRINNEGVPEVTEKVRGRKRAIKQLLKMVDDFGGKYLSDRIIGISHLNCLDEAMDIAATIKNRYHPREEIIISDAGATIGTYVGEGGILVTF